MISPVATARIGKALSNLLVASLLGATASAAADQDAKVPGDDERVVAEMALPQFSESALLIDDPLASPRRILRGLQLLQDKLADGSEQSIDGYRQALKEAKSALATLPNAVWKNSANIQAVALFLLIGGDPELGSKVISLSPLNKKQKLPLDAALAFASKHYQEALGMFREIAISELSLSVRPQFMLAQGMLIANNDIKSAEELFQAAVLSAPGTLIEEAAQRRLVRLYGKLRNSNKLISTISLYRERFSGSFYFNDYLRNAAIGLSRLESDVSEKAIEAIDGLAKLLETEQLARFLRLIANRALVQGNFAVAGFASAGTEKLELPGGDADKLLLVSIATRLVEKETSLAAVNDLALVDRSNLSEAEDELLKAVELLSRALHSDLPRPAQVIKAMPFETVMKAGGEQKLLEDNEKRAISSSNILATGNKALEAADILLKSSEQPQLSNAATN